jgi:hypothetical protein
VRDVDGRHAELVLQLRDLGAHLHPQLRVQVRERLVHEERLWLADDRSSHGHALSLAAGQRSGLAVEEAVEPEDPRSPLDSAADLVLRGAAQLQAERDVLAHRQLRGGWLLDELPERHAAFGADGVAGAIAREHEHRSDDQAEREQRSQCEVPLAPEAARGSGSGCGARLPPSSPFLACFDRGSP